jgi:hypothetical protein
MGQQKDAFQWPAQNWVKKRKLFIGLHGLSHYGYRKLIIGLR